MDWQSPDPTQEIPTSDERDNEPDHTNEPGRLMAFSDGVFGVAITLLVLNIQVPHLKDYQGISTLVSELLKQWPVYLSYVISFFTVGIVWANHHNTFMIIVRADHTLRMFNLFLLMTVTLIPFTTALLSEYIQQAAEQQTAAIIYDLGWVLLSIAYNLLWQYAVRRKYVSATVTPALIKKLSLRFFVGIVSYIVAAITALFSAAISIFICLVLVVFFLIPAESLPDFLQ